MNYYSSLAMDIVNPKPKAKGLSAALKAKDADFSALMDKAWVAGRKAGVACRPIPMVVGSAKSIVGPGANEIDYSQPCYIVDDGACGFAWVNVYPGNCEFARWLKAKNLARPGYPSGMQIWVSDFGQSVERKEACASAMAQVLRDGGIEQAYAGSRLD